mmetsp:Transcript_17484/g.43524  ORF Transcript_17484/g.43524 Transcript_17484/m.43524 type:complete len:216 (-) Transcript_17484:258-905(-)
MSYNRVMRIEIEEESSASSFLRFMPPPRVFPCRRFPTWSRFSSGGRHRLPHRCPMASPPGCTPRIPRSPRTRICLLRTAFVLRSCPRSACLVTAPTYRSRSRRSSMCRGSSILSPRTRRSPSRISCPLSIPRCKCLLLGKRTCPRHLAHRLQSVLSRSYHLRRSSGRCQSSCPRSTRLRRHRRSSMCTCPFRAFFPPRSPPRRRRHWCIWLWRGR